MLVSAADGSLAETLTTIADAVWSYPVVGLCLVTAAFLSVRLGGVQLRAFAHALALLTGRYDDPEETGEITHFQALTSALSGTIGIGNIAGVGIAIGVGGPGAIVWMWVAGLLGMATKYAECSLATYYRTVDEETGEVRGGPMHYIEQGLGPKWKGVAMFYAGTVALAGFGFSCLFQSNQAAAALERSFAVPVAATGAVITILVLATTIGGIKRIGKITSSLIPLFCLVYVLMAAAVCVMHASDVPAAFALIFEDALSGESAVGGGIGAAISWGVRRAVFSNEAGLGSAGIAHAAVKTDEPLREGIVASLGPFIDTIIVSGATALVIVLGQSYGAGAYEGGEDVLATVAPGEEVTVDALDGLWIAGEPLEVGGSCDVQALGCLGDGCTYLAPADVEHCELSVAVSAGAGEPRELRTASRKQGIVLSGGAFARILGDWAPALIAICGFFFALSTVVSWSYYGETGAVYLLGKRSTTAYRVIFALAAFVGAVSGLGIVVSLSDILVGLLVIPNTLAVLWLSPKVAEWSKDYFARLRAGEFDR